MKRTYERTMFITKEELPKAKVIICITEGLKWEDNDASEIIYTGLTKWSIVDGDDAKEIENDLSEDMQDENHEYLVLEFNDGSIATFGNSHVDMFIR